jgi:hypothetical protein
LRAQILALHGTEAEIERESDFSGQAQPERA